METSAASSSTISDSDLAYPLGFWSASIATGSGVIYFLVIVYAALTGSFSFPLPDWLQTFGGVASLMICPLLVILMASLHIITPAPRRSLSQISLGFTLLYALAVSINRFTQFGAVRQSLAAGETAGISWFLPYGARSIMLGMEMLGWGWFLGLAMLFAAPLFAGSKTAAWIRWCMLLYGVLGPFSAVCYLADSPLSAVGFAAWGFVLVIITGLMALTFRRARPGSAQ
jgi:hypothetical protein